VPYIWAHVAENRAKLMYIVRDHHLPVDRTLFERCALDESEVKYGVFRTLSLGVSTEMLAPDADRRRPLGHRRSP